MTSIQENQAYKEAEVWWSTEQNPRDRAWFDHSMPIKHKLETRESLIFTAPSAIDIPTITVFPDLSFQEILGIGTSVEESTIYNLSQMTADKQEEIYAWLLDPSSGVGFNLMRITLGTSDFTAQTFYSYNDLEEGETDFSLARFSIQKDIDLGIVSTLKRMLEISPDMQIFASSWSPPAWMKTSGSLKKGQLKEGNAYIEVLAEYYRKAIQAYQEQGIELYAITLQNEPLLEIDYPSCYMSPERQRELIIALKKELDAYQLHTKIWIFDHNFSDGWMYVCPILNDKEGYEATDGIAFHDYDGEPAIMSEIKGAYPDKTIHLTERSIWGVAAADRIAQYFRNWASSYNAWVTMLDSNIGTHQWVGIPDPTLIVQDANHRDEYWMTPEFFLTGQFSKFIQRGARRVESNYGSSSTVTNVAFLNPDNTLVVVVINQTDEEQPFRIVADREQIHAALPPKTAATYRWKRA
ncbi:glucosylceramidase [Paenibacillus baekrokdamisoli]|uniref:Glucosylceramidase n=1 Tax=Paenibacillus baekrokdamisoli TaxID=1712516 RepID=A0A3G9J9F5_9BACL|nr:glycoside hydrolase family 30 beta sandwich domain-containing protein [Paenibacillus baekrokdamisoli]MBB3071095.1 glucosylceramidase [Paenibacillus baekrokdamisoli]BBH21513.1 glucosylceramidase [Paenibacillus baekrokdamisoli]